MLKPKVVIANGDIFDGAQISRHPRIGWDNKPTVLEELEACTSAMSEIEKTAKKHPINTETNAIDPSMLARTFLISFSFSLFCFPII